LLNAVTGAFSIMFVSKHFLVTGDAAATVGRILGDEALYRVGVASDLLSQILFVLLGMSLHSTFRRVQPSNSRLLVGFILAALPFAAVSLSLQVAPLVLLHAKPDYLGFSPEQASSLVLASLTLRSTAMALGSVFWGLWLLPFASAVLKTGFMPRVVGYLLFAAGVSYTAAAFIYILAPELRGAVGLVSLTVAAAGELSAICWLLVKGVPRGDA
jgi:hypothetical protein